MPSTSPKLEMRWLDSEKEIKMTLEIIYHKSSQIKNTTWYIRSFNSYPDWIEFIDNNGHEYYIGLTEIKTIQSIRFK